MMNILFVLSLKWIGSFQIFSKTPSSTTETGMGPEAKGTQQIEFPEHAPASSLTFSITGSKHP